MDRCGREPDGAHTVPPAGIPLRGFEFLAPALIVAAAAFAVYAPTLAFSLVWDDPMLVDLVSSTYRTSGLAGLLAAEFTLIPGESLGYYRPLVLLSLWIDSLAAPHFAAIYHFTNVLAHATTSVLVFYLLTLRVGPGAPALLSALLFALHPVHVESVAFVSARTDLLASLFAVVSAIAWQRGRSLAGSCRWWILGGAAFGAAALAKEVAFALPGVLLAWDFLESLRGDAKKLGWWERNRGWIISWGLAAAAVLTLRWLWAGVGIVNLPRGDLAELAGVWATYLRLLVLPWPLKPYYLSGQVAPDAAGVAAAILLALGCLATSGGRGWAALAWVVAFLAPVSAGLHFGEAVLSERYLYLPSVGLSLLVGEVLARAGNRATGRWGMNLAAVGVLCLAASATVVQSRIWRDDRTLMDELVRAAPGSFVAHNNVAVALLRQGRYKEAIPHLQEVLRINPDHVRAHFNLGIAALQRGDLRGAVPHFEAGLRRQPNDAAARNYLGKTLLALGRRREAAREFAEAVRLRPDFEEARRNLRLAQEPPPSARPQ
jgi:tetratricopeptide (TPR) repeat protein